MARSVRHGGGFLLSCCKVSAANAPARARHRFSIFPVLLLLSFSSLLSASVPLHVPQTVSPYDRAVHARQALEAHPEDQRTKRDYERTLDLFRAVYHDNPASPKADASIFAVAELLAEEGRILNDEKSLNDAIAQYEFLRREYPSSRYRPDALLAEGNIYFRDLNDHANAKASYQSFLKQYPKSPLAAEVHKDLKDLKRAPSAEVATKQSPAPAPATSQNAQPKSKHSNTVLTAAMQSQTPQDSPQPVKTPPASAINTRANPTAPSRSTARPIATPPITALSTDSPPPIVAPTPTASQNIQPVALPDAPRRKGKLVQVTGVRHWSTAIYTRVAIDLGDEVQYQAARVPNPDRIFFDLHGAKLSPELIGKSVDVTDDGFLKRIRVAQFSNDVTRIVLDVSDVSDYSAFLLPNPYRLIIDIHGRKNASTQLASQPPPITVAPSPVPAPRRSVAATAQTPPQIASSAPPLATQTATASTPARPRPPKSAVPKQSVTVAVTNTPVSDAAATQEIASLGQQPDKIKATSHPTTAPIAASVAGTTPASQPELSNRSPSTSRHTKSTSVAAPTVDPSTIHEADPAADGGRSMVRALGLKIGRIVVDAGHGGHDSGTLGPDGIEEKDVVLDVSLRLGKLLKQRLGADVIFTRSDDTFIPLETRTAIANRAQADLFVSVHANSSSDPSARGVETYYLNFTSSPESLELAARENAVSQQSIHQLSDLVKKIALHDKVDESREFAADVQKYLYEGLDQGNPGLKDRGVKQAPFVVLIGANMPSILAEISFLTNPDDAHELRDPNYRQRIAESLYRGVARYVSGLSGVRLAENSSQLR
jgi:N-acetylmuramoyl-L-alanine amidase